MRVRSSPFGRPRLDTAVSACSSLQRRSRSSSDVGDHQNRSTRRPIRWQTASPPSRHQPRRPPTPRRPRRRPRSLTGRLCADPVLRRTRKGLAVTTIRIAVNKPDAEATFHSVVVWRRSAENVCQYKRKGHIVEVTGRPQTRTWVDRDGNPRETVEINAYRVRFINRQQAAELQAPSEKEVA